MHRFTDEEFEAIVEEAIESIPRMFLDELDNVAFFIEDEPDESLAQEGEVFGIYEGVSLYDRGDGYGGIDELPDSITIFKGPHERLEMPRERIVEEVRKTVVHEVGHYFGMDEAQIEAMGYGEIQN